MSILASIELLVPVQPAVDPRLHAHVVDRGPGLLILLLQGVGGRPRPALDALHHVVHRIADRLAYRLSAAGTAAWVASPSVPGRHPRPRPRGPGPGLPGRSPQVSATLNPAPCSKTVASDAENRPPRLDSRMKRANPRADFGKNAGTVRCVSRPGTRGGRPGRARRRGAARPGRRPRARRRAGRCSRPASASGRTCGC